jgi:hypothetical protein
MPIHGRRNFLKQAAVLAGAFSSNSLFHQAHAEEWKAASNSISSLSPADAAQNEDYWAVIQRAYSVNSNIINLNNGGVSPAPIVVQQAVERYNQLSNEGRRITCGAFWIRAASRCAKSLPTGRRFSGRDRHRSQLHRSAEYGDLRPADLKAGDEVIGTKQDYPQHDRGLSPAGAARWDRLQADQLRLADRRRRCDREGLRAGHHGQGQS